MKRLTAHFERAISLTVAVMIVLVLSGSQVTPSIFAPIAANAASKVLRIGLRKDYNHFDPQRTIDTGQSSIENALFRGLLRYDVNGRPAPSIAKEVPTLANGGISPDGKTYTYHLNDWKWSDGNGMVTADDFVYTYQRLIDPQTLAPYGNFFNNIILNATEVYTRKLPVTALGVKALDPKTFQVTLVRPIPYFNDMASLWTGYVVRKDNVERSGLPAENAWTDPANGAVVGSGPFRIVSWTHNNQVVFERNPNFSGSLAKLDQIQFRIIPIGIGELTAYQSGQVDIAAVSAEDLDGIKADPDLSKQLVQYTAPCTNGLAMDNALPPFNNKKVREAFSRALNRDERERVSDGGINVKQLSWLPNGVPGHDPVLGKQFDFDAAKAKQALADAGYPDGKGLPEVTFTYPDVPEGERVAKWYQQQFKTVLNVDIKLVPMDIKTFSERLWDPSNPLTGLYETGWCADYLHPSDWLQFVFGSKQPNDVFHFNDPKFDELSKAADAEMDPDKAMALYKQAQELLVSDFPLIFFNTPRPTKLVKPNVINLKPSPMDGGMIGGMFWEDIDMTP